MNINSSPVRILMTGRTAAALRLAARLDRRTMMAFLEVNLPLVPAYADAMKALDAAAVPNPEPAASVEVPGAPWVPMYKRPGYVGPGSEKP